MPEPAVPASLDDLALFVEVARTRSFTLAGKRLGVPSATLSRRIAAMEKRLGVRLFDRTTRRVALTPAAQRYLDRCAHLVDEARLAEDALRESAAAPSGHLRVSMPVDLGTFWVGPLLPEFARQNPGVTLDVELSARNVDFVAERVDVALRLGAVKAELLIARKLGAIKQALFAAPAYLDRRGRPSHPAELGGHDCLHLGTAARPTRWRLIDAKQSCEVEIRGRFGLNNIGLMRLLAERGMGIAMLSPLLARDSVSAGRLEPVLATFAAPGLPLHALTTSRLQPAVVRAFLAFLASHMAFD